MRIGHAHLKVRDLDRAIAFYTGLLGLRVVERVGDHYVFLTGTEMHHEIALQNVGATAPDAPAHGVGLYHVAFEVDSKAAFAEACRKLTAAGVEISTVDHRISWAVYFSDPDGNGLEIYVDTRHEPDGELLWQGVNLPLPRQKIG
jgi:catechol 2,3-dioxygenase